MNCRYAKDKSLQKQYNKKQWNKFTHKPTFTYCSKYECVCYARLVDNIWRCEHTEFMLDLYDRLWEYGGITFTKLMQLKRGMER